MLFKNLSLKYNKIIENKEKITTEFFLENYNKYYSTVDHFKQPTSDIVIIVNCTKLKSIIEDPIPACKRYIGKDFAILNDLIYNQNKKVDIYIISAQYGVIAFTEKILKYDITFNDLKKEDIEKLSYELHIREDLINIFNHYKIAFLLTADPYNKAARLYEDINTDCLIVTIGNGIDNKIKNKNLISYKYNLMKAAQDLGGFRSSNIKTHLVKCLLLKYTNDELIKNPNIILEYLDKNIKNNTQQANLF